MKKYKLDNRTLTLLKAQVCLTETFNHHLRAETQRDVMAFRLQVERRKIDTHFTVELGSERHTLTLTNSKKMHLKLADFIEEIVNGPTTSVDPSSPPHADRRYGLFQTEHKQQVFELIRTGGALSLDMGFELPINLAIHRNKTRAGITTIMSIGVKKPRTKCFTVCGSDVDIYSMVAESITHLATVATPAAHAA
ncbi:hypothetical protein G7025_08515 [Pseudomonas lurida]|jgi:hypothetical protein|uniref:Uncharacterized protein n=1 Tax=Pseudomonas libanensis TaxID=75588 RepID=A0ABR5MB40_9PSED|nr:MULTISPECIES: hypothetical protein [Pseudomonas]KPG76123.1 hypothetical protein AEQ48_07910 [Pseudomonas libanensis]MBA1293400.1 hypothetical protein [Pseudomonas lurida]